jgi:hypothetical protein
MKKIEMPTASVEEQEAIIALDRQDTRLVAEMHTKASEILLLLNQFQLLPKQRKDELQASLVLESEREKSEPVRLLLKMIQEFD